MRRLIAIAAALLAFAVLIVTSASGEGEGGGDYTIRAYFDNAGFLVNGEEVRIAGATVGTVQDVTVALPGEAVTEDGGEDPGKAVAVLGITDPGFQDFRTDASCLIRPQSLLGEKYVDCVPTQPRAPGTEPPPELAQIADGETGAGEYFLPLENNGKQVDLDLVNNITRQPEVDRFRLILNDLGAALAARGPDLAEVIRRANPALEQTDKVLAQLARQNKQLARLAKDSDTVLAPLAEERGHLAGFIRNSATAGAAAAERSNDIVAGFQEFPGALEELESTMVELRSFAEAGTPVARDLREAAPGLTGATKALRPFSRAGTIALTNLGDTTEAAGPDLAGSSPVVKQLRRVGEKSIPAAKNLNQLLMTLRKTKGTKHLMDFLLNSSNVFNGFDQFGHYLRGQLQITNCVEFVSVSSTGCNANWKDPSASSAPSPDEQRRTLGKLLDGYVLDENGRIVPKDSVDEPEEGEATVPDPEGRTATTAESGKGTKDLLEFLVGEGQ